MLCVEDSYQKFGLRYETLPCTFMGLVSGVFDDKSEGCVGKSEGLLAMGSLAIIVRLQKPVALARFQFLRSICMPFPIRLAFGKFHDLTHKEL